LPRGLLVELALVLAGVAAYFTARGVTEADPSVAVRNAHDVLAVERALGLAQEATLQGYVLAHPRLMDLVNWVYIWGHWPVIMVVLLWTWRRHPRAYAVLRNALVLSGLIGVVVFISYPVAPPRLADLGLLDTVSARSQAYRVLQPPAFVNQYAAIPSLHVGWNLLIGITIVRCSPHLLVRALGVLLPVAMAIAVILSANHYVVDGLLGALVALTGLLVAERLQRRERHEATSEPGREVLERAPVPARREGKPLRLVVARPTTPDRADGVRAPGTGRTTTPRASRPARST
jgi:hypothetical protein